MTTPGKFTPYSTIFPFIRNLLPGWVPPEDQERIASYQKYEEIFWSSQEGFIELLRGDNENPIFLPTARTLINTVNRYTGPRFRYTITGLDPSAVQIAEIAFARLFAREAFLSQYNSAKRYWLIRGDWVWHGLANPQKPAGRRLSLETVDPAAFFPVWDKEDPRRMVKVHLAEQLVEGKDTFINRLTYEKRADGRIWRSQGLFEMEEWWNLTNPRQLILPEEPLPSQITAIPVYHLKNHDPTAPFGSSELRGLESILLAMNQTMSDEDLTLAMEGLGQYATDGGPPRDENGDEVDLIGGPGRVLYNAKGLRRVSGVDHVVPYGEHFLRLKTEAQEALGINSAVTGQVQAQDVESGVALLLRMGSILAHTEEKDQHIADVHRQMFYDLCAWMAVYDELTPLLRMADNGVEAAVSVEPVFGDKLPHNLKQVITNVVELRSLAPPAISLRTAHRLLREAGLSLDDRELELLVAEAQNNYDPLAEPAPEEEEDIEDRLRAEAL